MPTPLKTPIPTDQPPPDWRDILATKEVSVLTGIPEGTLRFWATQTTDQGPPSFLLGPRRRVYRRSAVMEWIAEQERATTNRPAANG